MKKLTLTFATGLALLISGLTASASSDIAKLDVKKECNVEANGIDKVIATAAKYNKIAKEHNVEFMRLGMKASDYINSVNEAIKAGSKTIDVIDADKKKTEEVTVEFASWRACSFAISALVQEEEAKTTWRLASPSDGYKY